MKLKDTTGIKSVCIDGQNFAVGKDGTVDVPPEIAEKLKPFGFQAFVEVDKKIDSKKTIDK